MTENFKPEKRNDLIGYIIDHIKNFSITPEKEREFENMFIPEIYASSQQDLARKFHKERELTTKDVCIICDHYDIELAMFFKEEILDLPDNPYLHYIYFGKNPCCRRNKVHEEYLDFAPRQDSHCNYHSGNYVFFYKFL